MGFPREEAQQEIYVPNILMHKKKGGRNQHQPPFYFPEYPITAQTENASNHNPSPSPGIRRLQLPQIPKRHHNPFQTGAPAVYEPSARYGPDPHPPQSPKSALTVCCPLKFCAHYNTPRTNPAPRLEYAPSHNGPACAEKSVRETPLPPHDKSTSAQLFPAPKPAGEDKVNSPSPIHSRLCQKLNCHSIPPTA